MPKFAIRNLTLAGVVVLWSVAAWADGMPSEPASTEPSSAVGEVAQPTASGSADATRLPAEAPPAAVIESTPPAPIATTAAPVAPEVVAPTTEGCRAIIDRNVAGAARRARERCDREG